MILLPLVVACVDPTAVDSPADGVPADARVALAAGDPLGPPDADVIAPLEDTSPPVDPGLPVACPEDIYVAGNGDLAATPVLADAHAETAGAAPTPISPHLSWTGDPSTTIAAVWQTDADTLATQIRLTSGGETFTVDGRSFVLEGNADMGRVHEVRVCGLLPGVTYTYDVGGAGTWSEASTFTTGPETGSTDPFVFAVAGDTRGDPTTWGAVLAAMEARGAEFRAFTGDAVNSGFQETEWASWLAAGEGALGRAATLPAHGNHENLAQEYFSVMALPGNEQWFSVDYGNAHLVFVNDTPTTEEAWQEQLTWLAADLAASTAHWKLLFHHKPGYSSSTVHAEETKVRDELVPIAEAGGVQVDFAGHNHHYERSAPLRGGVEDPTGIVYVVTAGGGAPLYTNDMRNPYTRVAKVVEHYTIVRVQDDILTVYAYDLAGNILDAFSVQR